MNLATCWLALVQPIARSTSLFFFQSEGGIRDGHVAGVQTCALPILQVVDFEAMCEYPEFLDPCGNPMNDVEQQRLQQLGIFAHRFEVDDLQWLDGERVFEIVEIGRASCRERG